MRIIESDADHATIAVDDYPDLLAIRAIPEYRFVGPTKVQIATRNLQDLGLADTSIADTFGELAPHLFDYQAWVVEMALDRRRFAVFADTGLGKTAIQLDWARLVTIAHGGRTLIVAPLNVVSQTITEAAHFYGDTLPVTDLRDRAALTVWLEDGAGIGITNYEKIDGFDHAIPVTAVILDESSVLKASMGARRTAIMAAFKGVPYKLCCSATPAPNDRMEYGEHAFFLDVVRSTREFLAAFFVNRDGEWQLKRHGETAFYQHLASWSVFMRDPKAYGFADHLADLPPMSVDFPIVDLTDEQRVAARAHEKGNQPSMFGATVGGITSRTKCMQIAHGFQLGDPIERYATNKPQAIAELVNETHAGEPVIVWVTFDEEGDQLAALIPDAVHLSGRTPQATRNAVIEAFAAADEHAPRVVLLKSSMFGFGLNLQACRVQVFSTITDSFERFYQAVRRSHRYGQTRPVKIYVPLTQLDEAICQNVLNKEATFLADAQRQQQAYVDVLRPADTTERRKLMTIPQAEIGRAAGDNWTMVHGDSIAHMPTMHEYSVDLAVFSPPFANLFTYSSEAADMGNVRQDDEYRLQWLFFTRELARIMKPGRVVAIHCMDVIRFAGQHGTRHTYDYPSDLRQGMIEAGFTYHARVAIDKNPQIQATRTKDQNLLFVTLKRDALNSHPQASECVLMFRAPGESDVPVIAPDITNKEWITWAHHVWYDIRETDVLNAALAKEQEDERHICPLQLGLIERVVRLWSNPGELVFSPFAGIGSEGWESLAWGRRFYGVELKDAYWRTACEFLTQRESMLATRLFQPDADLTGIVV